MAATLELAISAIRSGRKEEGRQLLNLLIQQNPNDDKAWLWMSSVVNTDEQRARCLYHVLAIDPNSQIARKGLQILGIVVSDSRPVKIPRDSQPIKIPNPTPPSERRPFLIDPQSIENELPFKPVTTPFSESVEASPSVLAIDVEQEAVAEEKPEAIQPQAPQSQESPSESGQGSQTQKPSESVPAVSSTETQKMPAPMQNVPTQHNPPGPRVQPNEAPQEMPSQPASQPGQFRHPSEPVPVSNAAEAQQKTPSGPMPTGQSQNPSEPVPVVQANIASQPQSAPQQDQFGGQAAFQSPQSMPANQQSFGGQMSPNASVPHPETRPSQPVPVSYPNMGMAQGGQMPYYPAPPQMSPHHSEVTMGMPTYQPMPSQQNPSQPLAPYHSNTTMGMPTPAQGGQSQHPSEPGPALHSNSTMGMGVYGQAQMPQSSYNPGFHSNSTMMMPNMSEAEARARLEAGQAIPSAHAQRLAGNPGGYGLPQNNQPDDDEEDDGVNILAVIIFGTLSVTALGGLGMLILLMFTMPSG